MNIILPNESYEESARSLSDEELNSQRSENLQTMRSLTGEGWLSSPLAEIWRGHELALLEYQHAICYEWHVVRGHEDSILQKTYEIFWDCPYVDFEQQPPWWMDPDLREKNSYSNETNR